MPRLEEKDIQLIREEGIREMKKQAEQIIRRKLAEPAGKTNKIPKAGNPIYKAMHACRASSRRELYLAHSIPRDKKLSERQIDSIVNLLTRWIAREYNFYQEESYSSQSQLEEFQKE